MSLSIFAAVLFAAALHATWNAIVKGSGDKYVAMVTMLVGQAAVALATMPFVPLPGRESWPFLLAGVALHLGYQFFLLAAYRIGDLTQVYPIARGTAPLLVAAVSVLGLGVALSSAELIAILMIAGGIVSVSLTRRSDGLFNVRAGGLAFVTGCFIAAYSLVDGYGARAAGTAVGFYAWLAIFDLIVFCAVTAVIRPGLLRTISPRALAWGLAAGAASFVAFAIVLFAFTKAPIALVTALRETSIVFSLLIGVFVLKERLDLIKVTATALTLAGVGLLRYSRS